MSGRIEKPGSYYEAGLTIRRDIHEAVCNFIINNYSHGLVLEEEEGSDLVGIRFYVPENAAPEFQKNIARYINEISADRKFVSDDVKVNVIKKTSWEDEYKKSIKSIIIDNVVVRPPWLLPDISGRIELIIEPKMAFGTGSHETTQLCIKEILKHFKSGQTLFDLGCGSGILAILAAKIGAARVKGVDNDPIAVENSKENIVINDVANIVEIEDGSIERVATDPKYDFLAGNLIKGTIIEIYDKIDAAVKIGGVIVLSGLVEQDREPIEEMLSHRQISKYNVNQDGDWLSVTVFKG